MGEDGGVKISASAFVKAKAEIYLPTPLGEYPLYDTASTPQLVGALIYASPCGRPGETFAIGFLARALTFSTEAMDEHANRVLAYLAQNANEGIECKTQEGAQLVAYSDGKTIGFCIMYGGAAVSYGSKR
eukprot:2512529-Pleurochrysis_carterae.AAC.4